MLKNKQHILINQIKDVGDAVLALPLVGFIRRHYPDTRISFLATGYTLPVLSGCADIDGILNWTELKESSDKTIVKALQQEQISCVIHLCRNDRITKLAKQARIPYRIGTLQHLPNWLYCNRWVNQGRRRSSLNEAELNFQLLKPLGINCQLSKEELASYAHLRPQVSLPDSLATLLQKDRFNLILHPGSNGHAREWPSVYFEQLIQQLDANKFRIFLTGRAQEQERFKTLIERSPQAINVMDTMSLAELISFIDSADGLIASSTGPLHIAAAMGKKSLGLYAPRQGIHPQRWGPMGKQASYLVHERPFLKNCFSCQTRQDCACMTRIEVKHVLNVLQTWYQDEKSSAY